MPLYNLIALIEDVKIHEGRLFVPMVRHGAYYYEYYILKHLSKCNDSNKILPDLIFIKNSWVKGSDRITSHESYYNFL